MIDAAIAAALARGLRTADIAPQGSKTVGTAEMGDAVIEEVGKLAA
jgi:3-isopropylmalate dehydrogenase